LFRSGSTDSISRVRETYLLLEVRVQGVALQGRRLGLEREQRRRERLVHSAPIGKPLEKHRKLVPADHEVARDVNPIPG
jgi:hypothetical protein